MTGSYTRGYYTNIQTAFLEYLVSFGVVGTNFGFVSSDGREMAIGSSYAACGTLLVHPLGKETTTPGVL